jgi:hypothetical protein
VAFPLTLPRWREPLVRPLTIRERVCLQAREIAGQLNALRAADGWHRRVTGVPDLTEDGHPFEVEYRREDTGPSVMESVFVRCRAHGVAACLVIIRRKDGK